MKPEVGGGHVAGDVCVVCGFVLTDECGSAVLDGLDDGSRYVFCLRCVGNGLAWVWCESRGLPAPLL
jgi:hypothetical protein